MKSGSSSQTCPARDSRGFTLVQTVVTLAIAAAIAALSFSAISLQRNTTFDAQVAETMDALRQLQSQARTVDGNREYGITFNSTSWTSFWVDPATGTQTTITTKALANTNVTTSPAGSITFVRLTGVPKSNATTTITFTSTRDNHIKAIVVTQSGVIYAQ